MKESVRYSLNIYISNYFDLVNGHYIRSIFQTIKVIRPLLHHLAPLIEQVATTIGCFNLVFNDNYRGSLPKYNNIYSRFLIIGTIIYLGF